MKLTVVSSAPDSLTLKDLLGSAKKYGIHADTCKITHEDLSDKKRFEDKLAENVIWRTSNLSSNDMASIYPIMKEKNCMNKAIFNKVSPSIKTRQYNSLKNSSLKSYLIPTYQFSTANEVFTAVKSGILSFPMVSKPDWADRGDGVELITNREDVLSLSDIPKRIFQPYIQNDGDWRVFVVGGRSFGAMKKHGAPNDPFNFRFNEDGASLRNEGDQSILAILHPLAISFTAALGLDYAGVDITYDVKNNKFYFLEVNVSGSWNNRYCELTGENIPDRIIEWYIKQQI